MSYWDSSALVKLYAREADSAIFEQFATSTRTVPTTSRVALYEILTTPRRKEAEGMLIAGSAQTNHRRLIQNAAEGHIRVIEFSDAIEREFQGVLARCFSYVPTHFVRTLDAIHLASAIVVGETEFVATDKRLRDKAVSLGLKLFP